jgi:hypothetical protein
MRLRLRPRLRLKLVSCKGMCEEDLIGLVEEYPVSEAVIRKRLVGTAAD